jgi:hypothetical protein
MTAGTLERLIANVASAVVELESRLEIDNLVPYFEQLGTRFPPGLAENSAIASAVGTARGLAGGLTALITGFNDANEAGDTIQTIAAGVLLTGGVAAVLEALDNVATTIAGTAGAWAPLSSTEVLAFTSNLPRKVLDERLIVALESARPEFVSGAVLVGLIDRFEKPVVGAEDDNPPVLQRQLRLDRLTSLFQGEDYFANLFGWGSSPFDPSIFFARIEAFLNCFSYNTIIDTTVSPPVLYAGAIKAELNTSTTPPGIDLTPWFALPNGFSLSTPVGPGYAVTISTSGKLDPGTKLTIIPPASISAAAGVIARFESTLSRTPISPNPSIVLFGVTGGTRLEVQSIDLSVGFELSAGTGGANGDFFFRGGVQGGKAIVDFSEGDGFLSSLLSGSRVESSFDLGFKYTPDGGLKFEGGATLEVVIPVTVNVGAVVVKNLTLQFPIGAPGRAGFPIDISTGLSAALGPITATVEGIGLRTDITFDGGNLGFGNIALGFKPPTGAGISVDAGAVKGGGFLTFDENAGRYSGVIELQVFAIGVKAFGLLETKFPDGSEGYSFVIVIIAEFTPIQLGFGFTLLGIGGLVGVNRSINEQALGDGVRTGALQHLLFPQNVIQDAPAIIHDLATVFPAAKGHFIVGPMAKLGWGTPTLISADLGIIIEFPGPRLALLGLVRMVLPSADAAILRLQMAISGLLDFPAKKVSVDASLFDSTVAGFGVTADMAYRMQFGNSASFLLSVGGFNTGFQPPPPFPQMRRASVNFGINGNPSLVASGYFALTSNTAQIGASIQLRASGFGIRLEGWLGFDVLFVFSPFSFTASISAGVRVSFHGVGFGITLHGSLSGPSPWHLKGKVCVSVLWWDACLPVEITFGNKQPASLPEIDPWSGDNDIPVVGLAAAIADARNWAGNALPSEFAVVTLAAAATADRTPIDPLGAAILRQKVAPLNLKLQKFGQYRPKDHDKFSLGPGVGSVLMNVQPVTELELVQDEFAPDHFLQLTNEQKLALPSYESMDAGIAVAPNRTSVGSASSRVMEYVTKYIDDEGIVHDNQPRFRLTQAQLDGLLTRSAAALGGIRHAGTEKYILPGRPKKIQLGPRAFVVADACTLVKNDAITGTETSQTQALGALSEHIRLNPHDRGRFAVIPVYAARAA